MVGKLLLLIFVTFQWANCPEIEPALDDTRGLPLLRQLAEEAKSMRSGENIPFMTGEKPYVGDPEPILSYLERNQNDKVKFRTELVIDGVQAIGSSFYIAVDGDTTFSDTNARNCAPFLTKTTFIPVIGGERAVVPCISIGTRNGLNVFVAGLAEEGIANEFRKDNEFKDNNLEGVPVSKIFYDIFFASTLVPALRNVPHTNVYLRYSEMIDRVYKGKVRSEDFRIPITISFDEWPEVGQMLDKYKQSFYETTKWRLSVILGLVGQNFHVAANLGTDDIIEGLGLQLFYQESLISGLSIHVAVDLYCEVDNSVILPGKELGKSHLGLNIGHTRTYPNFGLGQMTNHVVKGSEAKTLAEVRRLIIEGAAATDTIEIQNEFHRLLGDYQSFDCDQMMEDLSVQYLQLYLTTTHAVYPKSFKPHASFPGAKIAMSGPHTEDFKSLRKSFNVWKNIIKQLNDNKMPVRLEFVIETKALENVLVYGQLDERGNPIKDEAYEEKYGFRCVELLFSSIQKSVYGVFDTDKNKVIEGALSKKVFQLSYIIPNNFQSYIANSIGNLYLMIFCPLLDSFDGGGSEALEEILSVHDMQGLLTVHLAENALLYMFDGDLAYNRDAKLLHKFFQISTLHDGLTIEGLTKVRNRCGSLDVEYAKSNKDLENLPTADIQYFGKYDNPTAYQRFFLLRQLAFSEGALMENGAAIVYLYLDSCIVTLRHFTKPLIPIGQSQLHKWLTVENYRRFFPTKRLPTIAASIVKDYFLSPGFLKNVDVIALYILRQKHGAEALRDRRLEGKKIKEHIASTKAYIKRHLLHTVTEYVNKGYLEVMYDLKTSHISDLQKTDTLMLFRFYSLQQHARITVGAETLFGLKGKDNWQVRFFFSLSPSLSEEIINDVFEEMRSDPLHVFKSHIERLNFVEHPVLPMIFRLWYAGADSHVQVLSSYKRFINHCAYVITLTFSSSSYVFGGRYLLSVEKARLVEYGKNRDINQHMLFELGLIKQVAARGLAVQPLTEPDIGDAYKYWLGRTRDLERAVNPQNIERNFYDRKVLNRFHYTPCDAPQININKRDQTLRGTASLFRQCALDESGYLRVPNVYFFIPKHERSRRFEAQKQVAVMKVDKAYVGKRWIYTRDFSRNQKFYPMYMDEDNDCIVGKHLHENLPYENMRFENGVYYMGDDEVFKFDERTRVVNDDILNYGFHCRGLHVNPRLELTCSVLTENDKIAMEAWRLQKHAREITGVSEEHDVNIDEESMLDNLVEMLEQGEQLRTDAATVGFVTDVILDDNGLCVNKRPVLAGTAEAEGIMQCMAGEGAGVEEEVGAYIMRAGNVGNAENEENTQSAPDVSINAEAGNQAAQRRNIFKKKSKLGTRLAKRNSKSMQNLINQNRRKPILMEELTDTARDMAGAEAVANSEVEAGLCREVIEQANRKLICPDFAVLETQEILPGHESEAPKVIKFYKTLERKTQFVDIDLVTKAIKEAETAGKRYALRSQGSVAACDIQVIEPRIRRIVCRDYTADVEKNVPQRRRKGGKRTIEERLLDGALDPLYQEEGYRTRKQSKEIRQSATDVISGILKGVRAPTLEKGTFGPKGQSSKGGSIGDQRPKGDRVQQEQVRGAAGSSSSSTSSMKGSITTKGTGQHNILKGQKGEMSRGDKGETSGLHGVRVKGMQHSKGAERRTVQQVSINIQEVSSDDWIVLEVAGDGSCMFHAIHIMLIGCMPLPPTESPQILKHVEGAKLIRLELIKLVQFMYGNENGNYHNALTHADINKNIFNMEGRSRKMHELQSWTKTLTSDWGDERSLKLLPWLIGQDVHILYAITSKPDDLDWATAHWDGPTNPLSFMKYDLKNSLGPPFALVFKQAYENNYYRGLHWDIAVRTQHYRKFMHQSAELWAGVNPAHFTVGRPLRFYLKEFHDIMKDTTGLPPRNSPKQGPRLL